MMYSLLYKRFKMFFLTQGVAVVHFMVELFFLALNCIKQHIKKKTVPLFHEKYICYLDFLFSFNFANPYYKPSHGID